MKKLMVALFGSVIVLSMIGFSILQRDGGTPEQPIAFSHKTHAGDYQISCLYCHANARRSTVAGIPSVQFCMGCHKITAADKPEIQKLKGYWDRQEPIAWIKIFGQPDFVHFSHVAHVRANVTCSTCHGEVQTMDRVQKAVDLTMTRCLTCHRDRHASIDCVTCHK